MSDDLRERLAMALFLADAEGVVAVPDSSDGAHRKFLRLADVAIAECVAHDTLKDGSL